MWDKIKHGLYHYLVLTYKFVPNVVAKIIYSLISIKVLCLITTFWLGTYLLMHKFIGDTQYVTMVTTIVTGTLSVREIMRDKITRNLDGSITEEKSSEDSDLSEEASSSEVMGPNAKNIVDTAKQIVTNVKKQ